MVGTYFNPLEPNPPKTALNQWFLNWQPRLGLAEDSKTTDFRLGFFVLIESGRQAVDNYEHICNTLVDLATKVALSLPQSSGG